MTDVYQTQLLVDTRRAVQPLPPHTAVVNRVLTLPHPFLGSMARGTVGKSEEERGGGSWAKSLCGTSWPETHGVKKSSMSKPQQSEGGMHFAAGPQQLSWGSPHWPPRLGWGLRQAAAAPSKPGPPASAQVYLLRLLLNMALS